MKHQIPIDFLNTVTSLPNGMLFLNSKWRESYNYLLNISSVFLDIGWINLETIQIGF